MIRNESSCASFGFNDESDVFALTCDAFALTCDAFALICDALALTP